MPTNFTVVDVREIPSTDINRRGQNDSLIIYQVEGGAPNTVTIHKPIAQVNDQDITVSVQSQETARGKLTGRTFTLP